MIGAEESIIVTGWQRDAEVGGGRSKGSLDGRRSQAKHLRTRASMPGKRERAWEIKRWPSTGRLILWARRT